MRLRTALALNVTGWPFAISTPQAVPALAGRPAGGPHLERDVVAEQGEKSPDHEHDQHDRRRRAGDLEDREHRAEHDDPDRDVDEAGEKPRPESGERVVERRSPPGPRS